MIEGITLNDSGAENEAVEQVAFADQRYFNPIVAQIDGGIDPSKLINPLTGKTAMEELNIDSTGQPINEALHAA